MTNINMTKSIIFIKYQLNLRTLISAKIRPNSYTLFLPLLINNIKMQKILFILIILLSFNSTHLYSSENDTTNQGIIIGVHIGVSIADNKDAIYYNGEPSKLNNIERILKIESYSDKINEVLNDDIKSIYYPSQIKYKPAVLLGADFGYRFPQGSNIIFTIQFCQLQTASKFSIETATTPHGSIENQNFVYGDIRSKENRFDIDLGYEHLFLQPAGFSPIIGAGVNFNALKVAEHRITIEEFSASIMNTVSDFHNNKQQGGNGFGGYAEAGAETLINEKHTCQLLVKASQKQIALTDSSDFSTIFEIYLRIFL